MSYPQSNRADESARTANARQRLDELCQQIVNEECPVCRGYLREDYDKLAREVNGDNASAVGTAEDFLRWLVAMDDPRDEQGCKDRQVVTLTEIISRARNLLGGA